MVQAQPLFGDEKDEITRLVTRLKTADARARESRKPLHVVTDEDVAWAEEAKLPREFFEYFELQRVA